MDPLSSAASIITVAQVSAEVIKYLAAVHGYSKERKRLREQVRACEMVLSQLQDNADDPDEGRTWRHKVETLEESQESPLSRLFVILNMVKSKLEPQKGLEKAKAALKWPFNAKELQYLVEAIEREKSLLQIAITSECSVLIKELKSTTDENNKLLHDLGTLLQEHSARLENDVSELRQGNVSANKKAILEWLSAVDYAPQHHDYLSRRQQGTGKWLLESVAFQAWLRNKKGTLFCPGIPGAGKTILTSIAIERLHDHFQGQNVGIAFIYCNFRRTDEQEIVDLLANVLKQFLQHDSTIPDNLQSLYDTLKSKSARPSQEDVIKAITAAVTSRDRAFVLVDALDECKPTPGNAVRLINCLSGLQESCGLNLFATSRFIPEIVQGLNSTGCETLEIRASDGDLERYLRDHMSQLPRFVQTRQDIQVQIIRQVIKFADGMFLLAQITISALEDKLTPKQMKTALDGLHQTALTADQDGKKELLSRAYDQAMHRIQSQKAGFRLLAERVLSCLIYSKRELNTVELQHALAVEPHEEEFDIDNLPETTDIVSVCAGFVTIDEHTGIIRLVHYTLQEYFDRTWKTWCPGTAAAITSACVTYLSFRAFGTGGCPNDAEFEARLESYPFYDYAARFWGTHGYDDSKEVEDSILRFLRMKGHVGAANQAMISPKHRFRTYSQRGPRQLNELHMAAYAGLDKVLLRLLKEGSDPTLTDSYRNTPILWAAGHGHENVVRILLATEGVNPDVKERDGRTPLSWAAAKGHDSVVQLLLMDGRVDIDSKDMNGHTPLIRAATHGWEKVVRLLLANDPPAQDIRNYKDKNALECAIRYHHWGVVKLLTGQDDVKMAVSQHKKAQRKLSKDSN